MQNIPRNWIIGGLAAIFVLLCGGGALFAFGPQLLDVAVDLEPLPSAIAPLPTLEPSPTPSETPRPTTGSLSGVVWFDRCPPGGAGTNLCLTGPTGNPQGNGLYEPGEPGAANVLVKLGAGNCPAFGQAEARTAADGTFQFDKLTPGRYCVLIDPAENADVFTAGNWSAPLTGDARNRAFLIAEVTVGQITASVNFGWDDSLPPTPTETLTPSVTPTPSITSTPTPSSTFTRTPRPTSTRTFTVTLTRTNTPTPTPSRTHTITVTRTPSRTSTATVTLTPSQTGTATSTGTPTSTATATATPVRGVAIGPTSSAQSGNPGTVVNYTLTVTNTGTAVDSFSIAISGAFSAIPNPTVITNLGAGASTSLSVAVTIPANAAGGSSNLTGVTVTSQGDLTKSALATLSTTVNPVTGVSVSANTTAITSASPSVVTYTLTLTNTGNVTDSFNISVTGGATFTATVNPPTTVSNVVAGGTATITVEVTIPVGQSSGAQDTVIITFTSQTNGATTTNITLTTTVGP